MTKKEVAGQIEIGDLAKDELTGFEGVVIGRTFWLTNCDRLTLQPRTLTKDGEPQKPVSFDIMHCKRLKKSVVPVVEKLWDTKSEIALGDTARDSITGFEGTVIARTIWIASADNILIQPAGLKDSQPHEPKWFNPTHLTLVKKLNPPAPKENRGGPMPEPRRGQEAKR